MKEEPGPAKTINFVTNKSPERPVCNTYRTPRGRSPPFRRPTEKPPRDKNRNGEKPTIGNQTEPATDLPHFAILVYVIKPKTGFVGDHKRRSEHQVEGGVSGECAHWALGFFSAIAPTGRGIFGGRPSGAGVYGQAGFLGAPGKLA